MTTTETMFKGLLALLLLGSLLAAGWLVLAPRPVEGYTKAFILPKTLVKGAGQTSFDWRLENLEGGRVVYSALYYANDFYLGREDVTLEHGESREFSQDFDLAGLGLSQPVKISVEIYSQKKRYRLYYWL